MASYNDYRRGDGTCGISYSQDGGRSWADSTVPNGFGRGDAFGSMPPPTQFDGTFYGDYAGVAATAYPVWSDTRPVNQFLCPGTGTPSMPPAICEGSAPNAATAIYTTRVAVR